MEQVNECGIGGFKIMENERGKWTDRNGEICSRAIRWQIWSFEGKDGRQLLLAS